MIGYHGHPGLALRIRRPELVGTLPDIERTAKRAAPWADVEVRDGPGFVQIFLRYSLFGRLVGSHAEVQRVARRVAPRLAAGVMLSIAAFPFARHYMVDLNQAGLLVRLR